MSVYNALNLSLFFAAPREGVMVSRVSLCLLALKV